MEKTVIYGMGSWVENHYVWLKNNFNIVGAYDRDATKKEKADEMELPFLTLEELEQQNYDKILITSTFVEEIQNYLQEDLKIKKECLSGNELYKQYEEKISNGQVCCLGEKYPDKTFYIVQRGNTTGTAGLLAFYNTFAREIMLAVEKGYIPIIDLKNYWNIYHENLSEIGKVNTWEHFFEQPFSEYKLDDVWQSSNVVFSNKEWRPEGYEKIFIENIVHDKKLREKYHQIMKKYMKLNKKVKEAYEIAKKEIFSKNVGPNDKVLGVAIRGTDYNIKKPYMHPIQPSLEQISEKIQEAIDDWNCTKIYVTAEEESSINYIKEKFPGKVFYMKKLFYDAFSESKFDIIGKMRFDIANEAYYRGQSYLIVILLFQLCDAFIGGVNGGTLSTLAWKKEFEHEYIFDNLGIYGIDDDAYIFTPTGKPIYIRKNVFGED